jgi:hypothetical protein
MAAVGEGRRRLGTGRVVAFTSLGVARNLGRGHSSGSARFARARQPSGPGPIPRGREVSASGGSRPVPLAEALWRLYDARSAAGAAIASRAAAHVLTNEQAAGSIAARQVGRFARDVDESGASDKPGPIKGTELMNRRRVEVGDHENTAFETVDSGLHHVRPGFDSGEEGTEKQEGEERFPRRRSEQDVPKASLADRLRSNRRTD